MSTEFTVTVAWTEVVPGDAAGPALVLGEPLSFWGGLDPSTGTIIDRNHPDHGATITDTVLLLPSGRGSSSASSVIAEAVRLGTAPRALAMVELDEIIVLGALVATELYDHALPVGLLARSVFDRIQTGMSIHITGPTLIATP